jgi:hypothetical protein
MPHPAGMKRSHLPVTTHALAAPPLRCRPFGVLLDGVSAGWRYQPVDWEAVTSRGFIKALQVGGRARGCLWWTQILSYSLAAVQSNAFMRHLGRFDAPRRWVGDIGI